MFGRDMTIGERFRAAREMAGLSIGQAVSQSGVQHVIVQALEKATPKHTSEDSSVYEVLAKTYHVSLQWLCSGVSDMAEEEFQRMKQVLAQALFLEPEDEQRTLLLLEMLPKQKKQC